MAGLLEQLFGRRPPQKEKVDGETAWKMWVEEEKKRQAEYNTRETATSPGIKAILDRLDEGIRSRRAVITTIEDAAEVMREVVARRGKKET